MRYKLKQTYYGSPKVGTIVELTETVRDNMPYYEGNGYSYTTDEVENYPHLWEKLENEIDNIEWDGIDHNDCPDYCDAYILFADRNGVPMSEDELDDLNEDRQLVHELLHKHLY
jgi:hypothetical protein